MTSWKPQNLFRDPDDLVRAVQSVMIGETNKNDKSDDGDGLDAVQPKAVKKKFKDRKDKDIDNDGDVDDSDKFLHKRRKAVSKAMKEESDDDVEEGIVGGAAKLLGKGIKKGVKALAKRSTTAGRQEIKTKKLNKKADKFDRKQAAADNLKKAQDRVRKAQERERNRREEVDFNLDSLDEAKMSSGMIAQLKKAYEPMRDKKISMDNAKKLTAIMNKFGDDKDILIQLMKADIPFVSQGAVTRLISKHGMKGAELNKMMKEDVDLEEKTKWKMGDGRPRGGAYIENERFWNLDIDALKYIMKDANTAMKANPTGRKAGKYADEVNDASTVIAWRKKNGIKEDFDLEEGFINLGGAKVKDDEKSILQHIKKTFPNVKKVKKDPQHGWIPVFEDVESEGYTKKQRTKKAIKAFSPKAIDDVLAVAKDNAANKHSPKGRDWGKLSATAAQKLIDKEMEKLGYAMTAGGKWVAEEVNPANKQHLCAKNVVHEQWGEGACLSEMHDDPDENGDIAWYDVMFEHGIEKQVSIEELKVTKSEDHIHSHHNKKKKVKEEDDVPCAECGKVHDGACAPEDMKEAKAVKEEEDEDGGEKTDAQKDDMDGDGEKDSKKKKKKKKDDEEESGKPDKIDTEPEIKTMVSEREMTDSEKNKLDRLKKKFEGGEMHKSMKNEYGDKGDDVFYGKLTKMAMGEEVSLNMNEKKDSDGGDENLMMALRKSVSLRGQHQVAFKDGSKVKVSQKDAQNLLNRLQKEKPAGREALMKSAYKSEKHFKMALKGKIDPKKNPLDLD